MITIKHRNIKDLLKRHKALSLEYRITRLVRVDKQWALTLEARP